jgi:hypothetical protein
MKALYYPKRTKVKLIEIANEVLDPAMLSNFEKFLEEDYVDIKMKDAIEVLRYVIKSTKNPEKTTKKLVLNKQS